MDKRLSYYGEQQILQGALRRLDEQYHLIYRKKRPPQIEEDIIRKIKEYGFDEVDSAFKIVAGKAPDNPKRTYNYVIGALRKINKEENN